MNETRIGGSKSRKDALLSTFIGSNLGASVARRLIPAAICLPIILGFLRIMGQRAGLYGTETGTILFAVSNIAILVLLILWMSQSLNHVEEERVKAQQELDRFFDLSIDPMCVAGFDGYFRRLNPAWENILGFSRAELMNEPYVDFIHPDDRLATSKEAQTISEGQTTMSFANRYRCKDNSYKWFQWNAIPFLEKQLIYAVARDITDQKRKENEIRKLNADLEQQRWEAEKSLNDLQHRYELILQSAGEGIYGVDAEGKTTFVNVAAATLLGYEPEQLIGRQIHSLVHHTKADGRFYAIEECPIYAAFRDAAIHRETEEVFWRKDGSNFPVEYVSTPVLEGGKPVGAVVIFRDITDLKAAERNRLQAEEQLRHSQKIEALGQLAGGVAHDFNNILMAISSYCELMSMKSDLSSNPQNEIREISKAAERGADLTRQLLAFSRKQILEPKVIDLNNVLGNLSGMLQRLVRENIELTIKTDTKVDLIKADPGQIEQVIINLVVNARDAIEGVGKISIEAENEYLDEFYVKQHLNVKPGWYVKMSISDTGRGMDQEIATRIFEPFFTTKEQGKGTGLGLSTVHGIIKQLGGDIWVYSEPYRGTVFRIYFPRAEEPEKTESREVQAVMNAFVLGNETILLVDDNEAVRAAIATLLEIQGYKVLLATSGKEAYKIAMEQPGIQLLITDMMMPELNGFELGTQLRKEFPELKILFLSGYAKETAFQGLHDLPGTAYLNKPVSMSLLLTKIRELLSTQGNE